MAAGKYIKDSDLLTRLNPKLYLVLFDDDHTDDVDQVNDEAVQQVIDAAEAEVDSYLVLIHDMPLPTTIVPKVDRLVKVACLDYASCFSFRRHPEYTRVFGESGKDKGMWAVAEKRMERLKKDLQMLPDIREQTGAIPKNTGGFVQAVDPRGVENEDDELNGRHFDDTGIF